MSFVSFFSRVNTDHVFSFVLCFVILRLGASHVEYSSLPHSLLWLSFWGFSFLWGLFSLWLLYPGVKEFASIVTLLYSFRLTQTSTSRTVLICVVCLRFCFPHYSSLCLSDSFKYFCHGPFLVLLLVPMVRLCCLLSLGSYSWLKIFTIDSIMMKSCSFICVCTSLRPGQCWESC